MKKGKNEWGDVSFACKLSNKLLTSSIWHQIHEHNHYLKKAKISQNELKPSTRDELTISITRNKSLNSKYAREWGWFLIYNYA